MPQCAVPLCKTRKNPFHSFPFDDQQLFDIWKRCISNSQLKKLTNEQIYKKYKVCDRHFESSCKIPGTKSIKKYSIPSLNVSGFKNNSNLSLAYNLYMEKQESLKSVKNVTLDHNYVDSDPKLNPITKIWIESELPTEESSSLDIDDPLEKSINYDEDSVEDDIIRKSGLKKYKGSRKKPVDLCKKTRIKCAVYGCTNKYGSFHKFPMDPKLCQKWIDSLGITTSIKDHMRVCSAHFIKSDFFSKFEHHQKNPRKHLKRTAIPFKNIKEILQPSKIICAANNCFNNNIDHKNIHFFRFPKIETTAKIWANNADREDLLLQPKFHQKNHHLCGAHFDKLYFKKNSKTNLRSDIPVIPTIFHDSNKLDNLCCNLFMSTSDPEFKNNIIPLKNNSKTLETYVNDSDISKITLNDNIEKMEYGEINYTYSLYEDFVSNPGTLNIMSHATDVLLKKDYCRLCATLCSVASLISIFDKNGHFTCYGEMLNICLPGKVHPQDKLPHWICSKCEYKLDVCCTSLKGFIEADSNLRKIITDEQKKNTKEQQKADLNPPMPPEVNKIFEEQEKKYQCINCDEVYDTKQQLVDHTITSHDHLRKKIVCKIVSAAETPASAPKKCPNLRYECLICNSLHEKKDSLIKHSLRYHPSNNGKIVSRLVRINNLRKKQLICLHCKEQFRNINLYRKHMQKHFKLNCDKCGKQFNRMYRLLAHQRSHEIPTYGCDKCTAEYQEQSELMKHQITHKIIETKCAICQEEFHSPAELFKHKKKHEKSLCNICGKLLSSSQLLKNHLEKHADLRAHKCPTCSKSFQTLGSLQRHKKIHSTETRYVCQVCGKQFAYLSILKSHMYSHSTQKPHVCELCGARFQRRAILKKHMTTHERIYQYKCKTCLMEFNSRIMFIRHKQQHSTIDKKPFVCDICSKKFLTKFQMIIHKRIHTGEKPYNCEQCGKTFRSVALVKQHNLIHMNVFPHQCNFCDRKFRRLQSLVVHRRTHTGEKPYPCPVCGRAFANRGDMNKHKINLHYRKNKTTPQDDEKVSVDAAVDLDLENMLNQDDLDSNSSILKEILQE